MPEILVIPVLQDNYVFLLHSQQTNETAVVDPAVAEPVLEILEQRGWQLTHLLNTHHHHDHVGGNLALKQATGCRIFAAASDRHRIPGMDQPLADHDSFLFGGESVQVLAVPGHTSGHIAYWLPDSQALFCGDTLFAMGCGRLFEGSPEQMSQSLQRLAGLPGETRVYCAHEYTEANGRFALSVEPGNETLQQRMTAIKKLRQQNRPTIPCTLSEELATNPFLRVAQSAIREAVSATASEADAAVFARLRQAKDCF